MLCTAPEVLCLEPEWLSKYLVAGRVATLRAKADAIYSMGSTLPPTRLPEWDSNYCLAGRVATLCAKAHVAIYCTSTEPIVRCATFGDADFLRFEIRNHIPQPCSRMPLCSAPPSTVHEYARIQTIIYSNLCGTVFWKIVIWHFYKDGPAQVGPTIECLVATPESTLSSKQAVPHPSKHNLHKWHNLSLESTVWAETLFT